MGQQLDSEQVPQSGTAPLPQGGPRRIPNYPWLISMISRDCSQFGMPVMKNEVSFLLGWFARRGSQLLITNGVVTAVAACGTRITSSALLMYDVHLDIHSSYDMVTGVVKAASISGR